MKLTASAALMSAEAGTTRLKALQNLVTRAVAFSSAMLCNTRDAFRTLRSHQAVHANSEDPRVPALLLQRSAIRICEALNITISVSGRPPSRGILVSNHLGYLDILAIGYICPTLFVSKVEVRDWPVFGWFARSMGTLFVRRNSRLEVSELVQNMDRILTSGGLVTLFPEGTSTDGGEVLPFRSSLLQPALHHSPVTVAAIHYDAWACYHGAASLLPHLMKVMASGGVAIRLNFAKINTTSTNRKELAVELHSEVVRLKSGRHTKPCQNEAVVLQAPPRCMKSPA